MAVRMTSSAARAQIKSQDKKEIINKYKKKKTSSSKKKESEIYQYTSAAPKLDEAFLGREKYSKSVNPTSEIHKKIHKRKEHKQNVIYTISTCVAVLIFISVCLQYLNLQSQIMKSKTEIKSLTQELSNLIEDNNNTETSIKTSIDYDKLIDIAIKDLGMIYPNNSHVISYNTGESEYVKQFADIPE